VVVPLVTISTQIFFNSISSFSQPYQSASLEDGRGGVLAAIDAIDVRALTIAVSRINSADFVDQTGEPALVRAAWKGSPGMIRVLLDHGGQPNRKDSWHGYSPLFVAALVGSKRCMSELIKRGADVRSVSNTAETLLMAAASSGNLGATVLAARYGTLNARDQYGRSSLAYAVQGKSAEVVRYLLRAGERVNSSDNTGHTPLHMAALAGRPDIAIALIQAGAAIEARGDWGDTPLIDACAEVNVSTIDSLLKRGANPYAVCDSGKNGLMQLCAYDGGDGMSTPELERSIAQGVRVLVGETDTTVRDRDGRTAADLAVSHGHSLAASVIAKHPSTVGTFRDR
jgi:ankyrin repeat protein